MKKITVIVTGFFLIISCSSSYKKDIRTAEYKYFNGFIDGAVSDISDKAKKEGKDQLLYLMEAGLMLHTNGEYERSNKALMLAAKIADNIPISIHKQTASLLLNERSTNYRGEDFERVLIHMYLGINFLMLEKPDEARVEFKQVTNFLSKIRSKGGRDYKQNLMAKYLTAVAFEQIGDMENDSNDLEYAYIEYKQILKLAPRLNMVKYDLVRLAKKLGYKSDYKSWKRRFGIRETKGLSDNSGEIIMIFQAGRSPIKDSRGKLLSDASMNGAVMASLNSMPLKAGISASIVLSALNNAENPIPKISNRSNKIDHLRLKIDGREIARTQVLERVGSTLKKNLEEDYKRLYGKVAAGVVTKVAASIAVKYASKEGFKHAGSFVADNASCIGDLLEQFIPGGKHLGSCLNLGGKALSSDAGSEIASDVAAGGTAYGLLSEIQPDLRCWHTLPANFQLAKAELNPGTHKVTIEFIDKTGDILRTKNETIKMKKGGKIFLNYRTLY